MNFSCRIATLVAGLLTRNQYPEGPATGHLGKGLFLVFLCLKANAEMVLKDSKFPLRASHVALPN
jgi:hypothetical protein